MESGRLTKLFPMRFNSCKENKELISLGISNKVQWLRFNLIKEDKHARGGNIKPMQLDFLVGNVNHDQREKKLHVLGDPTLHPQSDNVLRFFN